MTKRKTTRKAEISPFVGSTGGLFYGSSLTNYLPNLSGRAVGCFPGCGSKSSNCWRSDAQISQGDTNLDSNVHKILLVDDDDLSRRMMGLLLSEKGYNYDTASNGVEAIEAVQSQFYSIVLMDIQMPVMDGFEATSKIREWEAQNQHVPIVALTAMLLNDEIQKCLNVGMDDCIAKPFNADKLFKLIDTYINKPNRTDIKRMNCANQQFSINWWCSTFHEALPRFSMDVEIYREFLNEFIDGLPRRNNQIRTAFLSGKYKELAGSAHNLKGISASMGAKQL